MENPQAGWLPSVLGDLLSAGVRGEGGAGRAGAAPGPAGPRGRGRGGASSPAGVPRVNAPPISALPGALAFRPAEPHPRKSFPFGRGRSAAAAELLRESVGAPEGRLAGREGAARRAPDTLITRIRFPPL